MAQLLFNEPFDFAGHRFYAKLSKLDGYTVDMIVAEVDVTGRGNHPQRRLMLVHNSLEELSMDGKEVPLKISSSGRSKFPRVVDRETKQTLTDHLIKIICQRDPEIPLLMEDTFGKYMEEEEDESPLESGGFADPSAEVGQE